TMILPRLVTKLSPGDIVDLRTAWLVGLLGFLALSLTPFRAVLEARQLGYRVNLLLTAQALLIAGVSLAFASAGWGITGQAMSYVIGTWTFALAVTFLVFRSHPTLVRCWSVRADLGTHRTLWTLSAATFLFNVSGRVSLMADNSIVGSMLGASMVTSLVNTQKLTVLSQSLLQGIGGATWAPLAELHARGEHEAFNRRLIELVRLVAIMSLASLGPIVAFNRHFVGFWMPPTFHYGGDAVVIISAVNAFLLSQLSLWGWCFGATGKTAVLVPLAMTSAVVNVFASITLTRHFGLIGPLLGTLTAFLAVNLWWLPRLMRQVFGTSR
ncbi:lipopolysaccharide biosynthesis protein, partial [Singulisphaera rosea]